jgi:hypothetical protein
LAVNGNGRTVSLDILVENLGRVNMGPAAAFAEQTKGLVGGAILLNNETLQGWEVRPLTFKSSWITKYVQYRSSDYHRRPTAARV